MQAAGRAKTVYEISAGGVIYRPADGMPMVCLIKTPPHGHWQLPKGLVEKEESLENAAMREVKEETGLDGISNGLIDKIDYWFWLPEGDERKRHHKVVYFYLIQCTGGCTDNHDNEVEEACWVSADEAVQRLSFASEKKIVEQALEKMSMGKRA